MRRYRAPIRQTEEAAMGKMDKGAPQATERYRTGVMKYAKMGSRDSG